LDSDTTFPSLAASLDCLCEYLSPAALSRSARALVRDARVFEDASTRVVEKQEQGVIPRAKLRGAIGLCEYRGDDFGLPVHGGSASRLLRGDRENALVLSGAGDVVAEKMRGETTDGSESRVACGRRVAPRSLHVTKERKHGIRVYVIDAEIRDRSSKSLGQKDEEQTQRMGVCTERLWARSADAPQVIVEVRLNESEQRVLCRRRHGWLRRVKWSLNTEDVVVAHVRRQPG
jgi:hypothetical protein